MKDNRAKNKSSKESIENKTRINTVLTNGINTFIFNNNNVKHNFVEHLLSELKKNRIKYLDLDTSFRAKQKINGKNIENIDLIIPKSEDLEESFNYILSNVSNKETIIIDSINIISHLFNNKYSFSKKNKILGYYLSLINNLSLSVNSKVIIISYWGYKKTKKTWTNKVPGGRVLLYNSNNVFSVDFEGGKFILIPLKINGEESSQTNIKINTQYPLSPRIYRNNIIETTTNIKPEAINEFGTVPERLID